MLQAAIAGKRPGGWLSPTGETYLTVPAPKSPPLWPRWIADCSLLILVGRQFFVVGVGLEGSGLGHRCSQTGFLCLPLLMDGLCGSNQG